MIRLRTRMIIILSAFAIEIINNKPAEAELTLKIGTLAPVGTEWYELLDNFTKKVREKTDKIKITIYPGGIMGDEEEMIRKIRIGQLHGGGFTTYGIKRIAKELGAFDLPLLFHNYSEVDKVIGKFRDKIESYFQKSGYKLLVLSEQGFGYFFTKRQDISGFRDLSKTRIWGWKGEETIIKTIKIIGTVPIHIPVPDVLGALETGMIESFDVSPMGCLGLQWCKLAKTMIDHPLRYELGVVIIQEQFWNTIPQDIKKVLEDVAEEEEKKFLSKIRSANEKAKVKIKDMGVKFVKPTDEDIKWFESEIKKSLWSETESEILQEILKEIEKIRKGG